MSWGDGLQAHCPDSEGHPGVHLVAGARCLPRSHCGEAAGPKIPLRRETGPKAKGGRGEGRSAAPLRLTQRRPRERPAPPNRPDSDPDLHLRAGSSLRPHEVTEPLAHPEPASGPGPHRLRSDLEPSPPHVPPRLHCAKVRRDTGSDQSDASL